jgi:hypothetical protein
MKFPALLNKITNNIITFLIRRFAVEKQERVLRTGGRRIAAWEATDGKQFTGPDGHKEYKVYQVFLNRVAAIKAVLISAGLTEAEGKDFATRLVTGHLDALQQAVK